MKIAKIISQFLLGSNGNGGAVIQSVVEYDTGYIGVLFTTTDDNGIPVQTTPRVPALKSKVRDYYIEVPADKLEESTSFFANRVVMEQDGNGYTLTSFDDSGNVVKIQRVETKPTNA